MVSTPAYPASDDYDIIVIGAGVVGALVAWRAAQSNPRLRVLVLEAGEDAQHRESFVDAYVKAPVKSMGSPYRGGPADRFAPSPDSATDYYDQSGAAEYFRATYRRMLGGSTWHWRGNSPRLLPNDFRLQSTYGVGVDWPVTYEELEPFYADAERLLGVAGDHREWNGMFGAARSTPFPMSRVWPSLSDQLVRAKIDDSVIHGVKVRVLSTPQARNTQPYDGRPVCSGNSTCDPICPIGAKYDATVHVGKARAAGAQFINRAVVTQLTLDEAGYVRCVRYLDWSGGVSVPQERRARIFVLAAGAIESAKILLNSRTDALPAGLANSSGEVGRNLMDHLQGQVTATAPVPVYPFRGPPTTSGIDNFRDGPFRKTHSAFRMSIGNDGWGLVEGPYATLKRIVGQEKLIGTALRERVKRELTSQMRISYSTETLPRAQNNVTLSDKTDALGIPRPMIHFSTDDYSQRAFAVAQQVIQEIFERIGASGIRVPTDPHTFSAANHVLGTCRMGTVRSSSVADSFGRSHDHPNLFILGGSLFPTCGTGNPTLTLVALTVRATPGVLRAAGRSGEAS